MKSFVGRAASGVALSLIALSTVNCNAAFVTLTITAQNLAPVNSVSFAALRFGVGNGAFDAFNNGEVATAPIISIAERGAGADWFPAFAAAEPNATTGTVGGTLTPGQSATMSFDIDTSINRFFTFASMVVPSNDLFIGNDSPIEILDAAGNLLLNTINQDAGAIWDANSEVAIPENAAFLVGSVNANRVQETGVVAFDRSELSVYDGRPTTAGYFFNSGLLGPNDTAIYRITLSVAPIPEPTGLALLTAGLIGTVTTRWGRRRK